MQQMRIISIINLIDMDRKKMGGIFGKKHIPNFIWFFLMGITLDVDRQTISC